MSADHFWWDLRLDPEWQSLEMCLCEDNIVAHSWSSWQSPTRLPCHVFGMMVCWCIPISIDHYIKYIEYTTHANYLSSGLTLVPGSRHCKLKNTKRKCLPVLWFHKKYDGIAAVISDISPPSRNCTIEWWIVVQCWPLLWQWSILIGHGWSSLSMFISTWVLSPKDFPSAM